MTHPPLTKQDIVAILSTREKGNWEIYLRFHVIEFGFLAPLRKLTVGQIMQAVADTNRRLVDLVAHRMLIPSTRGQLVTRKEVLKVMHIAGRELVRQLPEDDQVAVAQLIHPIIDFLINVVRVPYADAVYEEEWGYVEALCALASAHMMDPVTYLQRVRNAQDNITRFIYDPSSYRTRQLASFDAICLELLENEFVACIRACEHALHVAHAARIEERILRAMVPPPASYWRVRALRLQRVEEDIHRIWFGGAQEV